MNIVVVGGGKVGYYLVKTLVSRKHRVSLIEKNDKHADEVSSELDILVIKGDGTSIHNLEQAEIEHADVLIAVTGRDEENLVVCQLAKQRFDVSRTIARINNPKNEWVFKQLGVDVTISSTTMIVNQIEKETVLSELNTLLTFHNGQMTVVEVTLTKDSPIIGKSLMSIDLPEQCVFVSIIRGDEVIFPKGKTKFAVGDNVIALTTVEKQPKLKRALIGKVGEKK